MQISLELQVFMPIKGMDTCDLDLNFVHYFSKAEKGEKKGASCNLPGSVSTTYLLSHKQRSLNDLFLCLIGFTSQSIFSCIVSAQQKNLLL